jgi:hypothetical protein
VLTARLACDAETDTRFIGRFLEPPVYSRAHRRGTGTLYTAVYRPRPRTATLLWPDQRWDQALMAFRPGTVGVELDLHLDP